MTDAEAHERAMMRHALGLDQSDKPYRNRYFAAPDSPVSKLWDAICAKGWGVIVPSDTAAVMYAVTDRGLSMLGVNPLPGDLEPSERYP